MKKNALFILPGTLIKKKERTTRAEKGFAIMLYFSRTEKYEEI